MRRAERAKGAVLHFAADWLPASEVFVYDLVRNLNRTGLVVAANRLQNTNRFGSCEVHSLAPLERFIRPVSARPRAFTAVLELIARRSDVSLVHVHHGYRAEIVVPLVQRNQFPLVLSLHGHDVTGYLERRPWAYADLTDKVGAVVVPSVFLVDHAVAAGFDPRLVRVMPSGVDTSFFSASALPAGDPVVVFVGRFVEKKGIDVLAAAWPYVQRSLPRARLRILGFGPHETLARSISGNVTVEIAPDRHEVRDAIRSARVVVSPSHTAPDDAIESLLVVNLEAQASGRPVVTTNHGAIPEYVKDGETALVVPESDADALAEGLLRVLTDDALATRLGSAGPAWAQRFDLCRTAAAMDALYDELLGVDADVGSASMSADEGGGLDEARACEPESSLTTGL